MVRAPCCEKTGLKRGPWTKDEDHLLITYINQHGHQNWRALPKKAGLLRCGKSCRLRWINYLRPDIKRGNFSKEEEDTIIQLHQVLGNRWSAIAAKLPGRTDNEIKNIWHTHLKKKLGKQSIVETQEQQIETVTKLDHGHSTDEDDSRTLSLSIPESSGSISQCQPNSPSHSSSSTDVSSSITTAATNPENAGDMCLISDNLQSHQNLDEDFIWLDVVSSENSGFSGEDGLCFPLSPLHAVDYSSTLNSNVDFWSDLFTRDEELLIQLPQF